MKTKQYLTGSGTAYQRADYTGSLSDTANTALSHKSGHTSLLGILGVNDLVFGVKNLDNQYAQIEAGHNLGLNSIVENSTVLQYLIIGIVAAVIIYFYFKNKK